MSEPKTFDGFDLLGRKQFAERLLEEIELGFQMVEGALVIALNAPFGGGKSTFLEMWKNELQKPKREGGPYEVLSINAWETDFAENPVIPIASTFAAHMAPQSENGAANAVGRASRKIMTLATLAGAQLVRNTFQIDAVELLNNAEQMASAGNDISRAFEAQLHVYRDLHASLERYVDSLQAEGKRTPLFVFVDELDRARPDYAIEFLETVKHLYSVPGIVYVLAIDPKQLESTVKVRFGEGTDFGRYLRRFVQLDVALPDIFSGESSLPINNLMMAIVDRLKRSVWLPLGDERDFDLWRRTLVVIATMYGFQPRDIEYFLRRLVPLLRVTAEKEARWGWWHLLTFLAAASIAEPELYEKIKVGSLRYSDLEEYFVKQKVADRSALQYLAEIVVMSVRESKTDTEFGSFARKAAARGFLEFRVDGTLDSLMFSMFGQFSGDGDRVAAIACRRIDLMQRMFG